MAPDADDKRAAELRARGFGVGRRVSVSDLLDLAAAVAGEFSVAEALAPAGIRVASARIPRSKEFVFDGGELLNSFFVADLARVAGAVEAGELGAGLAAYLRGPGRAKGRVDVLRQPAAVDDGVAPRYTPAGRWPAQTGQRLALSQQFAANTIMRELTGGPGLFAVNGPPGTGKTTMLRELIAAIVVERARRLADLRQPGDAFTREFRWKTGEYTRTVSAWREDLTGFEIVVASSNNGAVENISLEIPGVRAIDADEWSATADYYGELATALLRSAENGGRANGSEPAPAAWGLVAGLLGRKSNRMNFAGTFWFGERDAGVAGFQEILKGYEQQAADWPAAVHLFRAALREVDSRRAERAEVFASLAELPRVRATVEQVRARLRTASRVLERVGRDAAGAAVATAQAGHEEQVALQARESHRRFRPGFLVRALWLGKSARQWRARDRELAEVMADAERRSRDARARESELRAAQQEAADGALECQVRLDALGARLKSLQQDIAAARSRWGDSVPHGDWLPDPRERELAGAWTDPQWNAARSRLFLAALQLHQAFLAAEPVRMRKSLHAAMDVVTGTVGGDVPVAAVQAAWQSLFFVVPVFSTTFASFARVFSHLGRESLGWLFIDEAGQATPQAAAGAIWRCKRVVAVGDPMQLEPVVSLPFTAQQALREHFAISQWWLPSRTSAQRLADAANSYGTCLPSGDDTVWVGAPLRAHRRCLDPMFTISNVIAYDGLMVYGTPEQLPHLRLVAPESAWIDVPNAPSEGNWVPREGQQARRILSALTQRYGVDPGRIFVLSPFRDGASQIQRFQDELAGLRGGTVHTAQGKEADIVIFILGGNPGKPGTRRWASQRPNLVNVAVSRARYRLYVIGDFAAWSELPFFGELAGQLTRRGTGSPDEARG